VPLLERKRSLPARIAGLAAMLTAWTTGCLAGRDDLRVIVQEQCLPHWQNARDPSPCESLGGEQGTEPAYALLHDRKGGAHSLLIPTRTVRGIDEQVVLAAGAPNYFAAAWRARQALAAASGRSLSRTAVGMGINPVHARSQDQLHIHIECLGRSIYRGLQQAAGTLRDTWSPVRIDGADYLALRVKGEDLGAANPFALVAQGIPGAINEYTLLLAGMQFRDGPGFALLVQVDGVPATELLLDSSCAVTQERP
jgi:CDP-diacylglycerol pyrophosphatase